MRLVLSLAVLAGTAAAQAPLVLLDRNAIFQYSVYPNATNATTGTTPFLTGGVDHLPLSWWYYHVAGDQTGAAFNSSNNQLTVSRSADRRTGTLEWSNVDGRNFAARLVNTVSSTGSTTGVTNQAMTITNNTGAPLSITIYAYADIDIDGISSDDSAYQMANQPAGQTRVTDPSNNTVYFMANGYAGWQAALWPTLRDAILTSAHSLTNGTLPLTNQDYSGAFSWTLNLPANGSQTVYCLLAINWLPRSTNVATAATFGTAKAGTPGFPDWTLYRPFAGTTANLEITNGLTGAAPIVFIGTSTANVPLPPFGTVYVLPVATFNMPPFDASGVARLGLAVPGINSGTVHFQGLWLDPGAAGSLAHTNGLTWSIGGF